MSKYFSIETEEILEKFNVSKDGLNEKQVDENISKYGLNELNKRKRRVYYRYL